MKYVVQDCRQLIMIYAIAILTLYTHCGPSFSFSPNLNVEHDSRSRAQSGSIYFVSNQAANGYALGNDSNNGTSKATPFLTWSAAIAAAASGTIVGNPGLEYVENTSGGNNGLNLSVSGLTLETDSSLVQSIGKCEITSSSACGQVILLHAGTSSSFAIQDIVIDGAGLTHANKCGILGNNNSINVSLERVDFYGLSGGAGYCGFKGGGTGQTWNVDKCSLLLSNNNTSTSMLAFAENPATYNFTGCTCSGVGWWCKISANNVTVNSAASSDGTRNSMTNLEIAGILSSSGSLTSIAITCQATDWTYNGQTGTNIVCVGDQLGDSSSVTCTGNSWTFGSISLLNSVTGCAMGGTGQCTFTNNTCATTNNGIFTPLSVLSTTVSPVTVSGNNLSLKGSIKHTGFIAAIYVVGGPLINISNNAITLDGGANCVQIGNNSYTQGPNNTSNTTGFQNCGDTASDAFIDQPFKMGPPGAFCNEHYLGTCIVAMKAIGAGGTISYELYADSGGVASGPPLASATYTVSPTSTSVLNYSFDSSSRFAMVSGTIYHHVFSAASVSSANYVAIETNSNGAVLNTGSSLTNLSPGSGSLLFNTGLNCLECVSPKLIGNTLTEIQQSTSSAPHTWIVGGTDGAVATQNISVGGGIGQIFKLVDGSVHAALMGANLVSSIAANDGFSYFKGCTKGLMVQNTIVLNGQETAGVIELGNDQEEALALSGLPVWNGKPSTSDMVANNIVIGNVSGAALGPIVLLGSADGGHTCVNPILKTNCYWGVGSENFAQANLGMSAVLTSYSTLSAFKAGTAEDSGSIYADPLLASEMGPTTAGQFVPTLASPAANMGTNLLSIIASDFFGNPYTPTPWVGAFSLKLTPPQIAGLSVTPSTVVGGGASTGTVTFNSAVDSSITVTLSASSTVAHVPSSILVPIGASSANFTVTTNAVPSTVTATISASLAGAQVHKAVLAVMPATIASIVASPSPIFGGYQATGTVTLTGKAPPSGAVIKISSSQSGVTVPATVTISAGKISANFIVTTALTSANLTANLTAAYDSNRASTALSVFPLTLANSPWPKSRANSRNSCQANVHRAQGLKAWLQQPGYALTDASIGGDGTLYFGLTKESDPAPGSGGLTAVNPNTGAFNYVGLTTGAIHSNPAVANDDSVYIGCDDGNLYAFDGKSGGIKWTYQTKNAILASPAISSNGTVYIGSTDNYLYAINGATGKLIWKFQTEGPIYSTPAIGSNGTVYIGSSDRHLYAISDTGKRTWSFATTYNSKNLSVGQITSDASIDSKGNLWVTANYDNLYAVSSSGAKLWSVPTNSVGVCPSIDASNNVIVVNSDGLVVSYKLKQSTPNWKLQLKTESDAQVAVAIDADNELFVPDPSASLIDMILQSGPDSDGLPQGTISSLTQCLSLILGANGNIFWANSAGSIAGSPPPNNAPSGNRSATATGSTYFKPPRPARQTPK